MHTYIISILKCTQTKMQLLAYTREYINTYLGRIASLMGHQVSSAVGTGIFDDVMLINDRVAELFGRGCMGQALLMVSTGIGATISRRAFYYVDTIVRKTSGLSCTQS